MVPSPHVGTKKTSIAAQISAVAESVEKRFQEGRRVCRSRSTSSSSQRSRCATPATPPLRARHVRPLRHAQVEAAVGRAHALRLFDLPWEQPGRGRPSATRSVGQEELQAEIYRPLELRAGGAAEPAHPPARAERLGEEHDRRVHAARARALLDARRGRALPLPLGLPEPKTMRGAHRLRRRRERSLRGSRATRTSTTIRSTRASHRDPRSPALPASASPSGRSSSSACYARRRASSEAPPRLDHARQALAQEPAGLRGAPLELQRLARRGAPPRAGRALLHLAAATASARSPSARR